MPYYHSRRNNEYAAASAIEASGLSHLQSEMKALITESITSNARQRTDDGGFVVVDPAGNPVVDIVDGETTEVDLVGYVRKLASAMPSPLTPKSPSAAVRREADRTAYAEKIGAKGWSRMNASERAVVTNWAPTLAARLKDAAQ